VSGVICYCRHIVQYCMKYSSPKSQTPIVILYIAFFFFLFSSLKTDGKVQWCDHPHRILAYDVNSLAIAGGIHFQNAKTARIPPENGGYISAMAVSSHYRRKGVAKLLMVAAVEQLLKDGCTSSHLIVTQFGMVQTPHLETFYNRVGFIHHTTRFLTNPVVYNDNNNNNNNRHKEKGRDDSLCDGGGNAENDDGGGDGHAVVKASNAPYQTSSPRTGLYVLSNIPGDYASKVLG
jgi:GNAT superfamily N-acetyltransferase